MPGLTLATALLALQLAAPPRPADLERGLLASLPLDRDAIELVSGARLYAPGTRPVAGVFGGALAFDGRSAYLSLGDRLQPERFTIAAWVRPEAVDRPQAIVSKIRNLPGHQQRNLELRIEPGGRLLLHVPSGHGWDALLTQRAIPADRWSHVAAVYDGARATVWVDGVRDPAVLEVRYLQSRTETYVGARPEGGGRDGRSASGPDFLLAGALDEVRLYDRPLAEPEIVALATAPEAAPRPAPPAGAGVAGVAEDDGGDLARASRLAFRFDLACVKRDLVLLREVEARVQEELEEEHREARAERNRGRDRRLEVVRRAIKIFADLRGRVDPASLEAKRAALADFTSNAWRELAEDQARDPEASRRWAERSAPSAPDRDAWDAGDRDGRDRDGRDRDGRDRDGRDRYVPPPPPAPPPVAVSAMAPDRFERLHAAMKREAFAAGKLRVLDAALPDAQFSVAQVGRLMDLFSFSSERLDLVRRVRPRLVDPDQGYELFGKLTFDSEKEELSRILGR